MRALGVDTTRNFLVIVLIDGEKQDKLIVSEGNKKHTSLLIPAIDNILSKNNLKPQDIDYFSAVIGPGSFTGIRVGVSSINSMAYAMEKNAIAVTSFDLIAYGKKDGVALIDALHDNYYGAYFKDGLVTDMRYFEAGDEMNGEIFKQEDVDYAEAFCEVIRRKVQNNEVEVSLSPLYLRESQAEREAVKNG